MRFDALNIPPIAIHRVFEASIDRPFWELFDNFRSAPEAFLFDSARTDRGLGDFSYAGGEPIASFRAFAGDKGDAPIELRFGSRTASLRGDPWLVLRAFQKALHVARSSDAPAIPFLCGAAGYFGYEAARHLESIEYKRGAAPEMCLLFFDRLLAHDHKTGRTFLSIAGRGHDRREAEQAIERARSERRLDLAEPRFIPEKQAPIEVQASFEAEAYAALVEDVKRHILCGDLFELCLTQRFEANAQDGFAIYEALRSLNPAPFAAFLQLPELQLISASPERFLKLDSDGSAESRPIKGTRPRGTTPAEDRALGLALATSPKDRAENVMIVDLVRNDFGKVCEVGSIKVPALAVVEEYATVFQLVSTIRGKLLPDKDAIDLICAAFPGGSMTGAPKIEAMKIIERLEPVPRGVYSGGLGFIDCDGAMQLAMIIRSVVLQGEKAFFHAGGAVVADSDPFAEHAEVLDKTRALIAALASVRGAP